MILNKYSIFNSKSIYFLYIFVLLCHINIKSYIINKYNDFDYKLLSSISNDWKSSTIDNSGLGLEEIIYIDDHIIIVNKPANLQSIPGYTNPISLASVIQKKYQIERIDHMTPHRLDYSTSGIIIFTRNIKALSDIQKQFRDKQVYKRYSAIVNGSFDSLEGRIDLPIGKDTINGPPLNMIDYKSGRNSITNWKLIESGKYCSLVHLYPETGRTHQLRIHMAAISHHILGDQFYAPSNLREASDRLLLHAEEIKFKHPISRKEIRFITKCPFDLNVYDRAMEIE